MSKALKLLLMLILSHTSFMAKADEQSVARLLDQLHTAAENANAQEYFACFAENAIYIGTDADEHWDMPSFKSFVMPYFSKGKGWRYQPTKRHIYLDQRGQFAWFDELLENPKYGQARSSGAAIKTARGWKIVQYHLTFPIPNELAQEITAKIKNSKR